MVSTQNTPPPFCCLFLCFPFFFVVLWGGGGGGGGGIINKRALVYIQTCVKAQTHTYGRHNEAARVLLILTPSLLIHAERWSVFVRRREMYIRAELNFLFSTGQERDVCFFFHRKQSPPPPTHIPVEMLELKLSLHYSKNKRLSLAS